MTALALQSHSSRYQLDGDVLSLVGSPSVQGQVAKNRPALATYLGVDSEGSAWLTLANRAAQRCASR